MNTAGWTLAELAVLLDATVEAAPDFVVLRPVPADSDDPRGLTFCESPRYARLAARHAVGAVILAPGLEIEARPTGAAQLPYLGGPKW